MRTHSYFHASLLTSATLVIAGVLAQAQPAAAAPRWLGLQMANGNNKNACLDADARRWYSDGGPVQIYQCLGSTANPQWNQIWYAFWDYANTTIQTPGSPVGPGKCLDAWPVPRSSEYPWGYRISVYGCHGGLNQKWDTRGDTIRNLAYNLCLDMALPPGNGSYVGLYPCRSSRPPNDTQYWY